MGEMKYLRGPFGASGLVVEATAEVWLRIELSDWRDRANIRATSP